MLAAARADAEPAVEESDTGGRLVRGEQETSVQTSDVDDRDDEAVVVAAPVQEETRTVPASSWLLLALGQRPLVPSDHDAAVVSPDQDETVAVDGLLAGAGEAGTAAVGLTGDALALPGIAAPMTGSEVSMAADDTGVEAAAVELALETDLAAELAATRAEPSAVAFDGMPTADSDADPTAEPMAEATNQPAADAVARWRAAARALAGNTGPRLVASSSSTQGAGAGVAALGDLSGTGRPADGLTAVPGAAAREWAKLLGNAKGGAETGEPVVPALQLAGEAGAPEASTAGTRAADVLMRMAQSAGEMTGQGRGDEPGTSAFAQMMASAPVTISSTPIHTPTIAPPALPPAVGEQVNTHIVSSLKMQWKDGIGEAKLHLRPDAYGAVTVALKVEQGAVTAVVRSDNAQVQEWVLQHQQSLRQQMEAAGLHLEELTVSPDDRGQSQHDQEAQPQSRRRSRRSAGADEPDAPLFELLA